MNDIVSMILFDLDDTLLNSNKVITKRTMRAIQKCKKNGIVIGYITARSPRKVGKFLKGLPCEAIAYYNGAKVYCNDKLIASNNISFLEGLELINNIKKFDYDIEINAYFEPYRYINDKVYKIGDRDKFFNLYEVAHNDFQRILIYKNNIKDIKPFINDDMTYYPTQHGNIVITHKSARKGNAVITIAQRLKIDLKNIIAFGDDLNDVDMFKVCGKGIAMDNAVIKLKSIADYITDSNDNDGIAKYLEAYVL